LDFLLNLLSDSAFQWAALATILAGLVRGFSGFGAAMMFVPIVSVVYEPKVAVAALYLIDVVTPLPLVPKAWKEFNSKEVTPIVIGAMLTVPLGIYILKVVDPIYLRFAISSCIILLIVLIASGWRYKGIISQKVCLGLGTISGLAGGIASLYGPPLILFWMSRNSAAKTIRANIIMFFFYMIIVTGISLWFGGLLPREVFTIAIPLIPIYGIAIWVGAKSFRASSESLFKKVAYTLITFVAISSLPIWN
jgi:uncharacterized membrane protein YfcA